MATSSRRAARRERSPLPRLTPEQLAVATPAELEAYQRALQLELALASPLSYARHVSPWFEPQPHLLLLDRLIVDLVNDRLRHPVTGEIVRRLGVSMPPRHGKSVLISEHTPAWAITAFDWRIILASYEADFAATWGKLARQHIEENAGFGVALDSTSKANNRWDIARPLRGGMFTAGVGGPATGKGAHLLIIDDPVKNSEEARSELLRQRNKDWYTSTAKTRLEPGGYVIVLQTRWHEDDLLGWLTETQPDKWYYLNLPAVAGEDDALGRSPGEALCPAWYDLEALRDIESDEEDGKWFSAMYQGAPTTAGGGIFQEAKFRRWTRSANHYVLHPPADGGDEVRYVPADKCTRVFTVDLAATIKTSADYSVIATWDITPDREAILVDRVRERIASAGHLAWLIKHYRRLKPRYIIVESKTYGLTLIQNGLRQGLPVRPGHEGNDDKVAMAIPAGAAINGGRVYFPTIANAPWIPEFTKELTQFPNGTNDDQVDVLSLLAEHITTGALATPAKRPWEQKNTMEDRLDRWLKRKEKGRGRPRHPELGRL